MKSQNEGRLHGLARKLWWLHSLWSLGFGVGVMVYARKGLAHPSKLLILVASSWVLMFLALRFIVGAQNVSPDDRFYKRGLRIATNYFIKNLYQQMFFFLVPLYFASTTWSLESSNWWLAPLLLVCAVLSAMDLIMDNFVMHHRTLAALLYGICLFSVLNLVLPIAFGISHADALQIAVIATAPAVALLSFPLRSVFSPSGFMITSGATGLLCILGLYAHEYVPPAPLLLADGAVSYGTEGSREILGEHHTRIPAAQLEGLRCTTWLTQPGGIGDELEHVWRHRGREWQRFRPKRSAHPTASGVVIRSWLTELPDEPTGKWSCLVKTAQGQLIGRLEFRVVAEDANAPDDRVANAN